VADALIIIRIKIKIMTIIKEIIKKRIIIMQIVLRYKFILLSFYRGSGLRNITNFYPNYINTFILIVLRLIMQLYT